MKVMIKDLDDVLFRDVGGKIAADGRWDCYGLVTDMK